MKRLLIAVATVIFLIMVITAIKYGTDARQARRDAVAQADTVATVRAQLAVAHDSLTCGYEHIRTLNAQLDSMAMEQEQSASINRRLSAKAVALSARLDTMTAAAQDVTARHAATSDALRDVTARFDDTTRVLSIVRTERDTAIVLLKSRESLMSALRPWYIKWKHDATERNWLEKIFGADRAPVPANPEPSFPELSIATPDSTVVDSATTLQAAR